MSYIFADKLTTVHVNLRDEWLPYKKLIGQIILDVSCLILSRGPPGSSKPQLKQLALR